MASWRPFIAIAAAMLAFAAVHGLGRFTFAIVNPVMTGAGWLTPAEAAAAGSRDLVGYIIGTWLATRLFLNVSAPRIVVAGTALVAASYIGSAFPLGEIWLSGWRLLAGAASAFVMVVAPAAALGAVAPERRAVAGTIMFVGVGLGIVAGGLLVPALAPYGPAIVCFAIAAAVFVIALFATTLPPVRALAPGEKVEPARWTPALVGTAIVYGGAAVAFIPHTVFWGDYMARALGLGMVSGGLNQVVFGLGAALGPMITGWVALRLGRVAAIRLFTIAASLALLVPLLAVNLPILLAISVIAGINGPGIASLVSGRLVDLVGPQQHRRFWAIMTLVYAMGYGIGSQVLAAVFAHAGRHEPAFVLAAACGLLAVAAEVLLARRASRADDPDGPRRRSGI